MLVRCFAVPTSDQCESPYDPPRPNDLQGILAESWIQMQTLSRYFTFQVLNVFLVTTIAGFAVEVRSIPSHPVSSRAIRRNFRLTLAQYGRGSQICLRLRARRGALKRGVPGSRFCFISVVLLVGAPGSRRRSFVGAVDVWSGRPERGRG